MIGVIILNLKQLRPAWVEVNLDVFEENLKSIQKVVGPRCGVMAIVKANAYGHGAVECALVAQEAKCRMLGVAVLGEALELRRAGVTMPILAMGYTPIEQVEMAVQNDVDITVYSLDLARALSSAATRLGRWAKVHIKVETGMGRLGLQPGPALDAFLAQITSLPNMTVTGVFTHFAASDGDYDYTMQQFNGFRSALAQMARVHSRSLLRHCANSAAIMDFPQTYLDMVRPGILLYGSWPSESVKRLAEFEPPLSLKARIGHIRNAEAGETVGYGRTYTTDRPATIATLPIGYADGYNRALSNRGHVLVRGQKAPITGRVCMDQFMIDVTGIPGVQVGEEVVLIGRQGDMTITSDDLAALVGTIPHEILTRLGARVPRVYRRRDSFYTIDPVSQQRIPVVMS